MKTPLISFVVPHKGRENLLHETIKSITLQDFDLSSIEVIIVTQNDKLSEETLRFREFFPLSVYPRPVTDTISSLRNYGAANAKGEYLAFLDADIDLSPNWTSCVLQELHSNERRALISAIQCNSQSANSIERIRTALNNINKDSNVDCLDGKNLFLKHETFRLAGGFPGQLQTCEDIYFTNKVRSLGYLYLTSQTTFIHLGEDKDHAIMFKKEIWRGLSNLNSFSGRKVPLREFPSILIPAGLIPLLIMSLITLINGLYIPFVITASLMFSPVLAYSMRLYQHSRDRNVGFFAMLRFYMVYFSARSIGTYKGLYHGLLQRKL